MTALPVQPMLAESSAVAADGSPVLPEGDEWQFEFKWDGLRIVAAWEHGRLALFSRNGNDVSAGWPEVGGFGPELGDSDAVLDGEIVVMGANGRPDFGLLQQRMHVRDPHEVARLARQLPATLLLFDVMWFGGHDVRALPLTDRRALLERLELDGPSWKVPPIFVGDGAATLDAARQLQLEGVVAKRRASTYHSGRRSDAWRKAKFVARGSAVVCGWTEGSGRRSGGIGALVLGAHDGPDGPFVHIGSVGSGLDDTSVDALRRALQTVSASGHPFAEAPAVDDEVHWCAPLLVVEVQYSGWTRDGRLRHPTYRGIRADKEMNDVFVTR